VRRFASTIAAVIVLVLLGGYIYLYEWDTPAGGVEQKEKAFAGMQSDAIEEVQIKAAGGETSRATKTEGGWRLVEPTKAEADPSELSAVTSNLSSLEVQRVVDENPTDLARYGLNPPRVDVGFRVKGGKNFRHVMLGEKTPTGSDLYAKLQDGKRVFLVSSYLENTFNRTPFDLRDKSILEFDREKADSVEIATGATTLQFARSGSDWKIAKPITARGDYGAIEAVVTRLSSGQMQRIVEPEPADLKKYGLDKPSVTATVNTGSARAALLLGNTEGGSVYAKDASRPMVFAVEESLATDLKKDVGEFRRKDVFDFRAFNAQRVEITRGTQAYAFEKAKDKDGKEIWKSASGQNADTSKVEDLLTKLSNLRAQSFEAGTHAALKPPELVVTATFDGKSETVQFGRAGSDAFAMRGDEPGSAKLESTPYEDALKALDALK
jgi:hypothetical protein